MKERPVRPTQSHCAPYPTRSPVDDPRFDASRRRFLRQVGTGAGGLGLVSLLGLPRLSHGQSAEVDFSVLDAHPLSAATPPAEPPAPAPAPPTAAPSAPAQPMAAAPAGPADEAVVTEDRALWIEPGYVLLVRWERPAENSAVIAALEGSADAIGEYLSTHIGEMDDLHDLDRLHGHEQAITTLLGARVSPARVRKIHLDHDCTSVCGALGWDPGPERIPLPGVPPAPFEGP